MERKRNYRKEFGKTAREMAKELGLSRGQISNVFRGRGYASLPTALRLEEATGGKVKVEDMLSPEMKRTLRKYILSRVVEGGLKEALEKLKEEGES